MSFDLARVEPVWLDFVGEVDMIRVNNELLEVTRNGGKLFLSNLKEGENYVHVRFHSKYANNGLGLHTFTDAADEN